MNLVIAEPMVVALVNVFVKVHNMFAKKVCSNCIYCFFHHNLCSLSECIHKMTCYFGLQLNQNNKILSSPCDEKAIFLLPFLLIQLIIFRSNIIEIIIIIV